MLADFGWTADGLLQGSLGRGGPPCDDPTGGDPNARRPRRGWPANPVKKNPRLRERAVEMRGSLLQYIRCACVSHAWITYISHSSGFPPGASSIQAAVLRESRAS